MTPAYVPDTLPLFPELDRLLVALLRNLSPQEWAKPTLAPAWTVQDVALHLLDGSLRSLSMLRDGHFAGPGPASGEYADVVGYLTELNNSWVSVGRRLSPAVLTWLLELVGPAYTAFLATLAPAAPATFSVAWAGEAASTNHFHIAREYTEKWHHQQQIRQAVGQEAALLVSALYQPFVATSLLALPHHYRAVAAPVGTALRVHVTGSGGGTWFLLRTTEAGWQLVQTYPGDSVAADLELDGEVAWRLFTNSLPPAVAANHLALRGPDFLTAPIYTLLAVMA